MARFDHLMFVCTNAGREGDTKTRCAARGGEALLARLKACASDSGRPKGSIRVTRSGCLGLCAKGAAVLALSDAGDGQLSERWHVRLGPDDAEAVLEAALSGRPLPNKAPEDGPA